MAANIMQYLKRLGLRVPEDMAVIGMDNTYLSRLLSPQLTSVDFSKEEFSQCLVDTMLKLIDKEEAKDTLIKVSLAVRGSS